MSASDGADLDDVALIAVALVEAVWRDDQEAIDALLADDTLDLTLHLAGVVGHLFRVLADDFGPDDETAESLVAAWRWSRTNSSTDISPLVATTLALHGHLTHQEVAPWFALV